jgi:hypothetical protein
MRRLALWTIAVLAMSACAREYQPTPFGVVGPSLALVNPGQTSAIVNAQANCTLTQGFWKNHGNSWPVEQLLLGGTTYTKAQAIAILRTPPRGDATYILIHQLIAAKVNVASGADPTAVATVIANADAWLSAHPLGSSPGGTDREAGIALAALLDTYNSGLTGPGHCGETSPPPTPSPTPSPSPTPPPA